MTKNCFIPFKADIPKDCLPEKFPSPFAESPNTLCKLAAKELQVYLKNPIDWEYDFGLNQPEGSLRIGKMFGVLVVQNQAKELGYLAAFSGKLANKNHYQKFVPPIFDSLAEDSFLNIGMKELANISQRIKSFEEDASWVSINKLFQKHKKQADKELVAMKLERKRKKIQRDQQRLTAQNELSVEKLRLLNLQLDQESANDRQVMKKRTKEWKLKLAQYEQELRPFQEEIRQLKERRKRKSNTLQKQLFESYQFVNQAGNFKSLLDIFQTTKPVGGAGECAAPKLLQYAFLNKCKPIALAEFWWGKSPKSAIRKHGHFYPPCEEKCRPILGYMLNGL